MGEPRRHPVVISCTDGIVPRARYVFDTLFMACGIPVEYTSVPPPEGAWLLYAPSKDSSLPLDRCVAITHRPDAWRTFDCNADVESAGEVNELAAVFPQTDSGFAGPFDIPFDLVANAFYFLSSWSERRSSNLIGLAPAPRDLGLRLGSASRRTSWTATSNGSRRRLVPWATDLVAGTCTTLRWPSDARFAVTLSHDVDFLPSRPFDNVLQGGKTFLRHLIRQRDPADCASRGRGAGEVAAGGARSVWLRAGDHRGGDTTGRPVVLPGRRRPSPPCRRQLRHP